MESLINKFTNSNIFVFTIYMMSGGLETKDGQLRGRGREKVKNHWFKGFVSGFKQLRNVA